MTQFFVTDVPTELAGPVEMRLPCARWSMWHPSAGQGMIGQQFALEVAGIRRQVRIESARVDSEDPQYVFVTLVAVD